MLYSMKDMLTFCISNLMNRNGVACVTATRCQMVFAEISLREHHRNTHMAMTSTSNTQQTSKNTARSSVNEKLNCINNAIYTGKRAVNIIHPTQTKQHDIRRSR
mmetsp:Transcript_50626/g.84214  ORF Transcript_50626/g.84214 Transcript_50626/m.84214 type:complete len:104 (+) Transcript_50626:23-334(+)